MHVDSTFPSTFEGLQQLVARLRGPGGCPWDKEQTRASMRRYILEECYELLEAMEEADDSKVVEELGDVLLHLAFQIELGKEERESTDEDVFRGVIDKLVRRHPHVFGDVRASSPREIETRWQDIKRDERKLGGGSALDGVPRELPALLQAQSLQERAARTGFDWDDIRGVLEKVTEELSELQAARSPEEVELEFGDVLFSLVNVGRWLGADTESALRGANARFQRRFALMEERCNEQGASLDSLDMNEKEVLWQQAKEVTG